MEKLTRQQIFDRAYLGLASQNWRPCMLGDKCVYKMDDGKHCAIGWVVPEMSGSQGVYNLTGQNYTLLTTVVDIKDISFCDALQQCHDNVALQRIPGREMKMKEAIETFAKRYSLIIPEPGGQRVGGVAESSQCV